MKITPLRERVLLKVIAPEGRTKNGVWIPPVAQEKTNQGIIIDAGKIKTVEKEDTVIYDKFAGISIKIDGEEHLMIEIKDIIAIVEE